MRNRSRFGAVSLLLALVTCGVAWGAPATAAPPLPEPEIPLPPEPAPAPAPAPAPSDSEATYPSPVGATSSPPSKTSGSSPFAPPPNLSKNPIDVLPGDVVYPPLGDKPSSAVKWDPEWARFSTADWIITGTGVAVTLASAIIPPLKKHSLSGGILIDDRVRNALRLPTSEGRYLARDASDVILSLEATWPFFVDALITTWWYHGSPDAAAQMALVDGEALAIVTAVQGATNTIVSRERPYGQTCGSADLPNQTNDCEGNVHYRSFFSGHTAFTFMSAGLICAHHMKLDLMGGIGDEISCATAYAGAAATGVLRVMGDMHYMSDVTVGAAFGTLVGLAVPLIHYRRVNLAPEEKKTAIDWQVIPVGAGLGVGGIF